MSGISSSVVMYIISVWDQGPVCPDVNQQLLPAKTSAQSLKEFLFGLIADVSVAAVHTDVW